MSAKNIHVSPAGGAVQHEGGGQRQVFDRQDDAIAAGTKKAQQDHVELLIHGRDGQIRERNSFGHDPRDVKG